MTAASALRPIMLADGLSITEAARIAELSTPIEPNHLLPYYGAVLTAKCRPVKKARVPDEKTYGRISNPTVHVALNQLRRVVNAIVREYGSPYRIVLETTRQLCHSAEGEAKILKVILANEKRRARQLKRVEQLMPDASDTQKAQARKRLELWEQLSTIGSDRECPYCGDLIDENSAVHGRGVQIEHILPRAIFGDDSGRNLTLSCIKCNSDKLDRSPWQVFGNDSVRWAQIQERVARIEQVDRKSEFRMPGTKIWRFKEDPEAQAEKLVDHSLLPNTGWIAKAARTYLTSLKVTATTGPIVCTNGQMTGPLRKAWGLDSLKHDTDGNRLSDGRHHAVDAVVIACTTQSLIQRCSTAAGRGQAISHEFMASTIPYEALAHEVRERYKTLLISYKIDHPDVERKTKKDGSTYVASVPGDLYEKLIHFSKTDWPTYAKQKN